MSEKCILAIETQLKHIEEVQCRLTEFLQAAQDSMTRHFDKGVKNAPQDGGTLSTQSKTQEPQDPHCIRASLLSSWLLFSRSQEVLD